MTNYDKTKELVVGRWHGVFQALGIDVGDGRHTSCVICGGKDRFRFDDKEGKGTWFCNQCGAGDGWSLVMKKLGLSFKEALEQVGMIVGNVPQGNIPVEKKVSPEILRNLFVESTPATDEDPVGQYLTGRGLAKYPPSLRHHPKCWESETKKNQHAMLTVFHDANGQAVTIHRTFLDPDGSKLQIESPKKIMPSLSKMSGGAARICSFERGLLGIAEGVETAIAASLDTKIPVWAALTSTLLESFKVPSGVEQLYIFADNDKNFAGQKAAYNLANRVSINDKIPVTVFVPDRAGHDWLDVYTSQMEARR